MGRLWADNAETSLSTSLNIGVTIASVAGGTGSIFPICSGAGAPGFATDYFILSLEDAANNVEKIKVEHRSGDQLGSGGYPLIRGFDGTTPRNWPAGSLIELRWERTAIANFMTRDGRETKNGDLVMLGRLEENQAVAITAAPTTDLTPATGNFVIINHASGVLAVSSLGAAAAIQAGTEMTLQFNITGGTLSMLHGASLQVIGEETLSIEDGDTATFRKLSDVAAEWLMTGFHRRNGRTLNPGVTGSALLEAATPAAARGVLGVAASGAIGSSGITMSTARLLGRTTVGVGAPEELSIGAGLALTDGVLSASGGGGGGAVTSFGGRTGAVNLRASDFAAVYGTVSAGDAYQVALHGTPSMTTNASLVEAANFRVLVSGVIRVRYTTYADQSYNTNSRIYRNGSAAGTLYNQSGATDTYSNDISVAAGDTIQIFMSSNDLFTPITPHVLQDVRFGISVGVSVPVAFEIGIGQR